jgi:hypothetical protein
MERKRWAIRTPVLLREHTRSPDTLKRTEIHSSSATDPRIDMQLDATAHVDGLPEKLDKSVAV